MGLAVERGCMKGAPLAYRLDASRRNMQTRVPARTTVPLEGVMDVLPMMHAASVSATRKLLLNSLGLSDLHCARPIISHPCANGGMALRGCFPLSKL